MTDLKTQSGKAIIATIFVLFIVIIGFLVYLSKDKLTLIAKALQESSVSSEKQTSTMAAPAETPSSPALDAPIVEESSPNAAQMQTPEQEMTTNATPQQKKTGLQPGNPVVARVNGKDIKRVEVLDFISRLPANTVGDKSVEEFFPQALDEMVHMALIDARVKDNTINIRREVEEQLATIRKNIERSVYLQKQVAAQITPERLRAAYKQYLATTKSVEEIHARHILVPTKEIAQDIIDQLDKGTSFEALAIANSTDELSVKGGDLGYFIPEEVVAEFGAAAAALEPGTYSHEPIQTNFGWHVIKVEDKRPRSALGFEAMRPKIEQNLQREILEKLFAQWRVQGDVQIFDINGQPTAETSKISPVMSAPITEEERNDIIEPSASSVQDQDVFPPL